MNYKNFRLLSLLTFTVFLIGFISCEPSDIIDVEFNSTENKTGDFDFINTNNVDFSLYVLNSNGNPLKNVPLKVYDSDPYNEEGFFVEGKANLLFKGLTNKNGKFEYKTKIPKYLDKVYVCPEYIGVPEKGIITLNSSSELLTLGGKIYNSEKKSSKKSIKVDGYLTLGTWNSAGVPDYLVLENDEISSELLEKVNASLPERKPVPQYHPEYIADGTTVNVELLQEAEIWVTFLHEAAGWKNVLGYYTYPTNNPPASAEEIENLIIAFPNTSRKGSGGGLYAGNKVQLKYWNQTTGEFEAKFPAGTTIGWFLNANGWNGNVTDGYYRHYSNSEFNVEADAELQKHNVLLLDAAEEKLILGFEDIRRDKTACDQDFNDAIYYVTAEPFGAINTGEVENVQEVKDSDTDGVSDENDDYPEDEERAFDNYYPGEHTFGTFIFEDLWPSKGDYDFEDLVIDYNINQVTNADNEIVELKSRYVLKAIGAGYRNGFGFQLPIEPSDIELIEGNDLQENLITLNSNGTEAGQSKAVVVLFDNAYNILPRVPGFFGVNVVPEAPYTEPDTMDLYVKFANKPTLTGFALPPYNTFMIINQDRGKEIHLPNYEPTDLVNTEYFGTEDDNTQPELGIYYTSEQYYPWVIDVPNSYKHMQSRQRITKGYNFFKEWAESNGALYQDWFLEKDGYRNYEYIYPHGN